MVGKVKIRKHKREGHLQGDAHGPQRLGVRGSRPLHEREE